MSSFNKKISRRKALKVMTMTTAGAILAATNPVRAAPSIGSGLRRNRAAAYTGKFVIMSAGNPEQNAPLIKAIEDANSGVKVDWRFLPSERFVELFTAAEVAGDQIDLMDLNGQDLRRYAVGNRLKDLSGISYKDRFRDVGLNTYTIKGKLWALPRGGISGFPFLYNKKVLEQVGMKKEPETYDDLLALAPELKKAGIAPFVHAGKNIYLWPVWQFWAHGQTSGNKSVENTFKTLAGDMKFTDPEHVAALEILYKYAQDKMFIDSVNSLDGDGAWLAFTQGKALFFYEHTWRIGLFRKDKFDKLDLSLIAPLRSVKDANVKRQLPGGTGSALGISRSTTAFAIQPGGGVDIAVRPNVAIRLQGDYRALRDEGETFGEFRFAAGVVFGFGMR